MSSTTSGITAEQQLMIDLWQNTMDQMKDISERESQATKDMIQASNKQTGMELAFQEGQRQVTNALKKLDKLILRDEETRLKDELKEIDLSAQFSSYNAETGGVAPASAGDAHVDISSASAQLNGPDSAVDIASAEELTKDLS